MHELSIMAYVLESVEERAIQLGAERVLTINLVVGERSCIVDDSLLYYFDMLTPGTLVEGAQLAVRRTPMVFRCPACDAEYNPAEIDFGCPRCRVVGQLVDDGSDLLIESIEIES